MKGGEGRGSGKGWNSRYGGHWKLEKVFFNESVSTILQLVVAPSLKSKVVYRVNCWDCNDFYKGKTKRRLHDRKTAKLFKALTTSCHKFAIVHVFSTNHWLKCDHFEILATGRSDMRCNIKSLLIRDLKPTLNENVSSEKLHLYY